MRLGVQEIVIILAVIIVTAVIMRIFRTIHSTASQKKEPSAITPVKPSKKTTNRTRSYLIRSGVALILSGIILLLAGISMFRWAFQSYSWSFIIVITGFILIFLSRKIS